jgi:hypothetical protein
VHSYALDSEERRIVPFFLAIFGILAALALNKVLVGLHLSVPWWFDAPATMGFYSIFYGLFDRWLWRMSVLRTLRLVHAPFLDGRWRGEIASSIDEHRGRHLIEVEITQTWTKIIITLEAAESRSHSIVAGVTVDGPGGPLLTYEYLNEPKASAVSTMQMHRGVARLRLLQQGSVLEGDYFSGRGRETQGIIRLERHVT